LRWDVPGASLDTATPQCEHWKERENAKTRDLSERRRLPTQAVGSGRPCSPPLVDPGQSAVSADHASPVGVKAISRRPKDRQTRRSSRCRRTSQSASTLAALPQSPTASPQPRARRCAATIHVPLLVVCHADGHPLHPRLGAISWSPSTVTRSRARGFGLGPSAGCFESAESKRLDRNFWSDRALRLAVSPELEILEQLARIQPARRPDHLRCTETGTRAAPE
jgi:hypothetical protein